MSIESDVGRGVYETWPTGATRKIAELEIKIKESAGILSSLLKDFEYLEKRFKPNKEELEANNEERNFWKPINDAKARCVNWSQHLLR